jgi:hypothetical protein
VPERVDAAVREAGEAVEQVAPVKVQALQLGVLVRDDLEEALPLVGLLAVDGEASEKATRTPTAQAESRCRGWATPLSRELPRTFTTAVESSGGDVLVADGGLPAPSLPGRRAAAVGGGKSVASFS